MLRAGQPTARYPVCVNVVKRARSRCTQLRTRLQTPRCSAVFFALLLVSLAWISWEDEWYNRSTVGRFVRQHWFIGSARPTDGPGISAILSDECFVVWIDGATKLIEIDWQIKLSEYADKGSALVWLAWNERAYDEGWWAVTRDVRTEALRFVNLNNVATPEQVEEAKQLYVAIHPSYAVALNGRVDHVRLLWGGIVINIATLLAALAFMVSLGWVPPILAASRGKRRLAQGLCPKCAYDLTGLRPESASDPTHPDEPAARCPECGEPLPAGRA